MYARDQRLVSKEGIEFGTAKTAVKNLYDERVISLPLHQLESVSTVLSAVH